MNHEPTLMIENKVMLNVKMHEFRDKKWIIIELVNHLSD